MDGGLPVKKYQLAATFRDGIVEWTFCVETQDGERFNVAVRDGEEVPVLRDICRTDATVYYDAKTATLRTGWNTPGRE